MNYPTQGTCETGYAPFKNGASLGAISPATSSQIEQRLMDLENANKHLGEIVSGLQVKLQTVLTPQMANEGKGQATPKPIVSPLADRLDAYLNEHRHLTGILRDVFDRIAL